MPGYRVISSDNHVMEPPDLWASRIEAKYRDRCPQLVSMDGGEVWVCDGNRGNSPGQGAQPGDFGRDPGGVYRGRKSQDCWRQRGPGIQHIKGPKPGPLS